MKFNVSARFDDAFALFLETVSLACGNISPSQIRLGRERATIPHSTIVRGVLPDQNDIPLLAACVTNVSRQFRPFDFTPKKLRWLRDKKGYVFLDLEMADYDRYKTLRSSLYAEIKEKISWTISLEEELEPHVTVALVEDPSFRLPSLGEEYVGRTHCVNAIQLGRTISRGVCSEVLLVENLG